MTDHPTLAFPFGRDVDTLVVCKNESHRRDAIKALGISAMYETIGSCLAGRRFVKIIVLLGDTEPWSEVEIEHYGRIIRQDLPTKLTVGGKMYVI